MSTAAPPSHDDTKVDRLGDLTTFGGRSRGLKEKHPPQRPYRLQRKLPKYLTYTAARKKRKAGVLSKDPGSLRGFYIGALYALIERLPTVSAVSFVAFAGFADSPI
jgi:hypothetical protein